MCSIRTERNCNWTIKLKKGVYACSSVPEVEPLDPPIRGGKATRLLAGGKQTPVAKLLVSVLSSLAEIDYNNRREAQAEDIARAKSTIQREKALDRL